MGNLLFSPNGRIGPSAFMQGVLILVIIAAVLQLLPLVSMKLAMTLGLLGLITYWCWVVLWIKRLRDAGKSGWLSIVIILIWLVIMMVVGGIISAMFGMDMATQMEASEAMNEAAEAGDMGGMMEMVMNMVGASAKQTALPSAIAGAVVSYGYAFIVNNMLKSEPGA